MSVAIAATTKPAINTSTLISGRYHWQVTSYAMPDAVFVDCFICCTHFPQKLSPGANKNSENIMKHKIR
jgi:hypothetical protein